MTQKRSKEVVSTYMSKIRSKDTKLEKKLEEILKSIGLDYIRQPDLFGKPDFAYPHLKIAIFADSDFWHGFNWKEKKKEIKTNRDFWIQKIERNIHRDIVVTETLQKQGWAVLRLWGHDIHKRPNMCINNILNIITEVEGRANN